MPAVEPMLPRAGNKMVLKIVFNRYNSTKSNRGSSARIYEGPPKGRVLWLRRPYLSWTRLLWYLCMRPPRLWWLLTKQEVPNRPLHLLRQWDDEEAAIGAPIQVAPGPKLGADGRVGTPTRGLGAQRLIGPARCRSGSTRLRPRSLFRWRRRRLWTPLMTIGLCLWATRLRFQPMWLGRVPTLESPALLRRPSKSRWSLISLRPSKRIRVPPRRRRVDAECVSVSKGMHRRLLYDSRWRHLGLSLACISI